MENVHHFSLPGLSFRGCNARFMGYKRAYSISPPVGPWQRKITHGQSVMSGARAALKGHVCVDSFRSGDMSSTLTTTFALGARRRTGFAPFQTIVHSYGATKTKE